MKSKRWLTILFTDGKEIKFDYPLQIEDQSQLSSAIKQALSENQLVLEVEGAMYAIPFVNVKYIRVSPCPDKLPDTAIMGVRLVE